MLTWANSNLQRTTKHLSKNYSPLVSAGKIAISVCSVILHCQKYHFFS